MVESAIHWTSLIVNERCDANVQRQIGITGRERRLRWFQQLQLTAAPIFGYDCNGSNQGSHTIHNLTIDRRQMLRCAMAADGQSRDTDSLLFNLFAKAAQTGKVEDGDAAIVDLQQPGIFQFA